jgi:hypothetical protein
MPKAERVWGVMFTSAGLSELREEFQFYWEEGPIGPYLFCKEVDMSHQHLVHIIVDLQDQDDSPLELEFYVPYHYIKLIGAGGSKEKLRRVIGFTGKNK